MELQDEKQMLCKSCEGFFTDACTVLDTTVAAWKGQGDELEIDEVWNVGEKIVNDMKMISALLLDFFDDTLIFLF